jgi:hypothetical protein
MGAMLEFDNKALSVFMCIFMCMYRICSCESRTAEEEGGGGGRRRWFIDKTS